MIKQGKKNKQIESHAALHTLHDVKQVIGRKIPVLVKFQPKKGEKTSLIRKPFFFNTSQFNQQS